jgi:monooxygenase
MSEREHLDVLVVGAGLSGIAAGHYLQTDCPWASYAIFEGRESMGGTWDLFKYPGIRSDSDMHTLGYSFRPWDGKKSIADGADILQYIKDTAAEEGIDQHIRYQHKVVSADWSSEDARWNVTAERGDTGETIELTAGFLLSCSGYYRYDQGYQPDFPGMGDYLGQVIHPQHWPEDLDYEGKRIVVIGSGATAVTLIPALAKTGAAHVTMLQRSPTYIVSVPDRSPLVRLLRFLLPDRWAGQILRWVMAVGTQGSYFISKRRPELVKRVLRSATKRQLPKGFPIDPHFTPKYNPWDERLCAVPNGDLFKAIKKGSASVVTDTIDTFTDKGIRVSSGEELEADIVVSATGLQMLFVGGVDVTVDGQEVDVPNRYVYKGMMLEGVPNAAIAIGYTNASWTLKTDLTCQYVMRLLNHMRANGMRQCTPVNSDPTLTEAPLLGLTSGYIRRAADQFPKSGSRFPWQVHQSFVRDYRAMTMKPVVDEAMVFSNPVPEKDAMLTA